MQHEIKTELPGSFYFTTSFSASKGARADPRVLRQTLDTCAATWGSPSPGNSAPTETNMSKTILYTTDENSTTGIREASFQEVLDAARLALTRPSFFFGPFLFPIFHGTNSRSRNMTDSKKTLISSALRYINGIKHLGNLAGSLLPADIHARYRRQIGDDVLFICATDEHGTPAELAAAEAGLPVADYCAQQRGQSRLPRGTHAEPGLFARRWTFSS
jgi:hypothetical protein